MAVNGIFDKTTKSALMRFQRDNGLDEDGILGKLSKKPFSTKSIPKKTYETELIMSIQTNLAGVEFNYAVSVLTQNGHWVSGKATLNSIDNGTLGVYSSEGEARIADCTVFEGTLVADIPATIWHGMSLPFGASSFDLSFVLQNGKWRLALYEVEYSGNTWR